MVSARATQMPMPSGPAASGLAAAMAESLDKMRAMAPPAPNVGDPATTDTLWAMTEVVVGGGAPPPVSLSLQRGMSVSGTVAFDGVRRPQISRACASSCRRPATRARPIRRRRPARRPSTQRPLHHSRRRARPLSLSTSGRRAGRIGARVCDVRRPRCARLSARRQAGRGSSRRRADVRAALVELSWLAQDATGKPVTDYTLVVFPADTRYWLPQARRIQATRPATDGRFLFTNLPAGDYRLVAVVDPEPGQWFDPAFLRQLLPGSMAVTLAKGEKRTQDMRPGPLTDSTQLRVDPPRASRLYGFGRSL